jgi:hypothetical protein
MASSNNVTKFNSSLPPNSEPLRINEDTFKATFDSCEGVGGLARTDSVKFRFEFISKAGLSESGRMIRMDELVKSNFEPNARAVGLS